MSRTVVTDGTQRAAKRLQRPSWRDGRLIAGVFLVLAAMLAGAAALSHFDTSVQVLRAKRTLLPGDTVGAGDFEPVKARLDAGRTEYLSRPPTGTVVREVRTGELVPRSAIGTASQVRSKSIGLPVAAQSSALVRGSSVDIWVARRVPGSTGTNDFQAPTREVTAATVHRVPGKDTALGASSSGEQVYVLVPDDKVQTIIAAVNGGAKVTLVPLAGSPLRAD